MFISSITLWQIHLLLSESKEETVSKSNKRSYGEVEYADTSVAKKPREDDDVTDLTGDIK